MCLRSNIAITFVFVFVTLLNSGCGGGANSYTGPKRLAVSGKVLLDGQPLASGTISFIPMEEEIRPAGGPIENGEFAILEAFGPNVGKYQIDIRSPKPTGKQIQGSDGDQMVDEMKESIPDRYNVASKLTEDVSTDKTVFEFDLTTSK